MMDGLTVTAATKYPKVDGATEQKGEPMADLIDRKAAITAIAKFMPYAIPDESTESYKNGLMDAYNLICQLPSAQPTQTNAPNALKSLDCISRQAVIDALNKHSVMFGFHLPHEFHEVKEEIRGLPSAQPEPKTGRWIGDRLVSTSGGTYGVRRCSECGAYYQDIGYGWNFCPKCGAKMEGEDDG